MKDIISAVPASYLEEELNDKTFFRTTNHLNNELHIITHKDAPYVMDEIGRLREITFRNAGGGTGDVVDIDEMDIDPDEPYKQLVLYNPRRQHIVGAYRFQIPQKESTTTPFSMFNYFTPSQEFYDVYLPHLMELGRSFVRDEYQTREMGRESMFALDNLFDGLGGLMDKHADVKYFNGKVTLYNQYPQDARDYLYAFFNWFFRDTQGLLTPKEDYEFKENIGYKQAGSLFGTDYEKARKHLQVKMKEMGTTIPPLIKNIWIYLLL